MHTQRQALNKCLKNLLLRLLKVPVTILEPFVLGREFVFFDLSAFPSREPRQSAELTSALPSHEGKK